MNKRDNALARIKFCGYHQSTDWLKYYIENRISYQAAQEAYRAGYQAKVAGVKCNCQECTTKTDPTYPMIEGEGAPQYTFMIDTTIEPVQLALL